MTEAEWLACGELWKMLAFVRKRSGRGGSEPMIWPLAKARRSFRLLACACCREGWEGLTDRRARRAVEAAEGYALGTANSEELDVARGEVRGGVREMDNPVARPGLSMADGAAAGQSLIHDGAARTAAMLIDRRARRSLGLPSEGVAYQDDAGREAWRVARIEVSRLPCGFLRDIVGNPFRPIVPATGWRNPDSLSLAQAAYDERIMPSGRLDLDRLAVLSDALEEAGCDDSAVLDHLRSPGPHVRGCWALDLVLGKG